MHYLEFPLQKASYNLALEEALFTTLPDSHPGYFILWQNLPAVIIGRNQILQEVINLNYVQSHKIPVIRRNTGGGAVYHDEGNLNYSFLINASRPEENCYTFFLQKIISALKKLGINADISGRNDLELCGKKFSGTSQLRNSGKILHHGTLLFNVDFEILENALHVDERKYKSKGIASLRARVINLCEAKAVSLEDLKSVLMTQCSNSPGKISGDILRRARQLIMDKYESDEWNYGKSPTCTMEKRKRFTWGELVVQLDIRGGKIHHFALKGDIINLQPLDEVQDKFINILCLPENISSTCESINWENYILGSKSGEIRDFLSNELFA